VQLEYQVQPDVLDWEGEKRVDGTIPTLIPIKPAQGISTEKCGKEIIRLLISQGPTYQHQ
jgi:hypothetical protein